MKRKMNYDFLDEAKKMPPLYHTLPGCGFDIMKSDVAEWLINIPEIRQKIFNMAVNKGVIVFDVDTGKWKGAGDE